MVFPISNINLTFSFSCHSVNLVARRKFGYLKRQSRQTPSLSNDGFCDLLPIIGKAEIAGGWRRHIASGRNISLCSKLIRPTKKHLILLPPSYFCMDNLSRNPLITIIVPFNNQFFFRNQIAQQRDKGTHIQLRLVRQRCRWTLLAKNLVGDALDHSDCQK